MTAFDLDALATKIGERGTARDTRMSELLKGVSGGIRDIALLAGLLQNGEVAAEGGAASDAGAAADPAAAAAGTAVTELVKGDVGEMPAKDDETEDEDPDTEDTGDNMAKGGEAVPGECGGPLGAPANGTAEALIDATDLVKGLQDQIEAFQVEQAESRRLVVEQGAKLDAQESLIKGQSAKIDTLTNVLETLTERIASGFGDLTKGVAEGWSEARARVTTEHRLDPNVAGQLGRFEPAKREEGGHTFNSQALVKGLNANLLTNNEVTLYEKTGLFSNDASIHKAKSDALLKKLAS